MRVFIYLALLFGVAEAAPRVVVLDFDGPAPQASTARAQLLAALADRYPIVATQTWADARAVTPEFRTAAKRANVDAIVEGWLDPDRTLTIAVRNARTGKELEQIHVQQATDRELLARLDGILATLAEPEPVVPPLAVVAKTDNILATIFQARPTEEQRIVMKPERAPLQRFAISVGPYMQSRGMTFTRLPNSEGTPPEYPGSPISGISAKLALHPLPSRDVGGRLTGPGVSLEVAHSLASTLDAIDDQGVYHEVTLTHTSWEAGARWRFPIDLATLDIGVGYGETVHALDDAFPESVAIPNTSYRYVSGGARVDLAVTERASVGIGGRYLYLLDAGQVVREMWYGAGTATGYVFDGQATIPLPYRMFVTAGIEYRKVTIDLEGSGVLTNDWGLSDVRDTAITGSLLLGIGL